MRENNFIESYKCLAENKNRLAEKEAKAIREATEKRENFLNDYYALREGREQRMRAHGVLMEDCRNDALATALKAIYITALEAGTLTDHGVALAESMVDNWIKEKGGASKILNEKTQSKSYFLARLAQIVEDAAEEEAKEVENTASDNEPEMEEITDDETTTVEEDKPDSESLALAAKVIEKKLADNDDPELQLALSTIKKASGDSEEAEVPATDDVETEEPTEDEAPAAGNDKEVSDDTEAIDDKADKPEEASEEGEEKSDESDEEDSEEESDKSDSTLNDTFDDVDEDESEEASEEGESDKEDESGEESDDETDVADDIVDDEEVPEEDITVDGGTESNGKVFDELEKEDDVKKAVELIRQRVADAEETFIKRNNEDKKQIDQLISRISDNVKTVEDLDDEAKTESVIAKERANRARRQIKDITEFRPLSIMERFSRNLEGNIIKNESVKESFLTESGQIDSYLIMESAKVMYGFLETLNTLQLESIDARYLEKLFNEMD